jgi:hypothetical protein
LQKNSLLNGLDSSTEDDALFKRSFEKKFVAPSTVKKRGSRVLEAKKIVR